MSKPCLKCSDPTKSDFCKYCFFKFALDEDGKVIPRWRLAFKRDSAVVNPEIENSDKGLKDQPEKSKDADCP